MLKAPSTSNEVKRGLGPQQLAKLGFSPRTEPSVFVLFRKIFWKGVGDGEARNGLNDRSQHGLLCANERGKE